MILDDRVKGLLDGRAFAVLATLNPDGAVRIAPAAFWEVATCGASETGGNMSGGPGRGR